MLYCLQGFQPIRLDYVPYLRQSLLHKLRRVQEGSAEVQEVVEGLDCYGLTKEDLMENLKELQMVLDGDKTLAGIHHAYCHLASSGRFY